MNQTTKLLGSTKSKRTKYKYGENIPHLEIAEVVLIYYNVVNNDYKHDPGVLYKFVPNKYFDKLLNISPKNVIFLENFHMNVHILKSGLQIRILNHLGQKIK